MTDVIIVLLLQAMLRLLLVSQIQLQRMENFKMDLLYFHFLLKHGEHFK